MFDKLRRIFTSSPRERALKKIKEAAEKQLEELDLSNKYDAPDKDKLTEIPEEVFKLKYLKVLKLNYHKISHLPESLSYLTSLNKLCLRGNQLTSLPEFLGNLTSLKSLDLGGNQLTSLPEFLGNLTSLNNLYLGQNQLTSLPESLGNLTSLNELHLGQNQLTSLPESLGNLTSLNNLHLFINQLTSLPESLGNLTNLNRLYLSKNQLTSLPESLGNLTRLNELLLNENQLTSLPESLGNITILNELYLNGNQLMSLPESLSNLTSLNKLYLNENQLTSLPEFLGNLTSLKTLYLNKNQLTSLPEFLGNLTSLKTLNLGQNQLTSLPESLGNLTSLKTLNSEENQRISLSDLPDFVVYRTSFKKLNLEGNPLKEPPIEIATKGVQAIKEYFEQLRKEGQDYIYEAKLLIVGEGGTGKTTLANKILDPQYELQDSQPTTEGIDVMKWSFPTLDKEQKEREFKVNIWDFGGQEIYHATHQFFLTKRSLYSLVTDTRKEDTDFYYWLNIVELLSDNSPLLIIKNEKQDRKREINDRALRGRFTNLEKTLATNLATNRGLDDILTDIKHYIQKLPLIGQALPKTWVKVRQALEQDSRNYISLQEYLDICETNGFTKLKNKLQLSGYLHDLGVCLHFQDEEDSLLCKTVILKPEWGTAAVYKVLDNEQVINKQGHFTRKDLKNIWQDEKYAHMRGELLELMKKFQLCYKVPESKDTFIAPQLLSNNQPEYQWDEANNLILRYAYPDFMPKGIVTRFIVIMHQYIEEQKYVWKTGVILSKDNTRAEVIENYGKREIRIRVVGNNKRNFLTIVSHEIDKINGSYKRLKYQKLIPCNCETCKNIQDPHTYKFNNLLERIANNQFTVQCDKPPYNEVQIFGLIDNAIDIKQFASEYQQDIDRSYNFKDIQQLFVVLAEQGNISGGFMQGDKKIIDQSRTQDFSGATIHNTGGGAFSSGDIYGTVANTINQLPSFDAEPNKKQLKELLSQLQNAVLKEDLDDEEKEETLEQIQAIAEALQDSQDGALKKTAKRAMKMLRGTAAALPPSAAMVTICNQLPDLISKIF